MTKIIVLLHTSATRFSQGAAANGRPAGAVGRFGFTF